MQGTNFRDLLIELIEAKGWTQAKLGDISGTGRAAVNHVITGRRVASAENVGAWASVLGLSPEQQQFFFDLAATEHLDSFRRQAALKLLEMSRSVADVIEKYRADTQSGEGAVNDGDK